MSSNTSATPASSHRKQLHVIEPKKCVIDDFEIIAFENEEQLNFYSLWHKVLVDKRRGIKTEAVKKPTSAAKTSKSQLSKSSKLPSQCQTAGIESTKTVDTAGAAANNNPRIPASRVPHHTIVAPSASVPAAANLKPCSLSIGEPPQFQYYQKAPKSPSSSARGHLLLFPTTINQHQYKLNKLYNKYRGIQSRRNFVLEKQAKAKIEQEISKSVLTPWTAYTALQALRLPELNITNQIFAPVTPFKQPMQAFLCIDRNDLITYSNKINPQQVADYRQKSHLLPSSATSKKSSAASYDVYEIMDVLVNSTKTSITITRNANRSAQCPTSIYSHSVNTNANGIVSTQLHLQARSYLDSMHKFYAEEHERLKQDEIQFQNEPSEEEQIGRYIRNANHSLEKTMAQLHHSALNFSGDSRPSHTANCDDPNQFMDCEQDDKIRDSQLVSELTPPPLNINGLS